MKTEDWLNQGNLEAAIAQARQDIEQDPQNLGLRFLLFELLFLTEDFDQAEAELRVAASLDSNFSEGAELYLGLLRAERSRHNFLVKGEGAPHGLLPPPVYGAKFIQALDCLVNAQLETAETLLTEGWQAVPKLSGNLNGKAFTEIRDADDILGPFLEALVPDRYFWLPFEQIQSLEFLPQAGYQDTIWMPAYIEMQSGVKGDLWIPALYSGTGKKSDFSKLGQLTEWEYPSPNIGRAYGQRDLKTGEVLIGIRQVSTIFFDLPQGEAS